MGKIKKITAKDVAGDSDYFNKVVVIGRTEWECLGYSRTCRTVVFARLVEVNGEFKQINKYVNPNEIVKVKL